MMSIKEIKEDLKRKLSPKRYEHTLGVEYTAACLALRYGADMEKARLAGLLHDCAKYLSAKDKVSACENYGIPISDYERKNPELLHAKLGACFANEIYGVTDPEILSAITWHTTGCPSMSVMEKIIFIADYIEPNRNQAEDLPIVRPMAFKDLDACLLRILEDTIDYLAGKKSVTDPMTQKTFEYYKGRK
ncbi:MAG: bis(5'-nucleosyl)-tetraphosphatase (symmetrical) YqeK [Eubacterium sp.]|nr:bis(5'-nucleosyl)-tetraphosphatase (symmetrical) YqeK [Eubacterium sp.]MDD7210164.1 bis(5'-nucleosyl)-tetraphosphatase (symmetrical) YqeK [Lachnospiraceae bacterium]MDY5497445.1 bis(5'-nucleosyl)-tetraphosphatase (symmetrical) YqeK [Anaerobutyricum sp.]